MMRKALSLAEAQWTNLPPLVHTDWRLSDSAACLKEAKKPAHYCRKAGRLETCGRKTCISVTF